MKMIYPQHKNSIHKGQLGKVLVIGGSPNYYGAPILTGLGAEAAGADLIHLYTSPAHLEAAKHASLNFFLHAFPQHPGYLSLYDVKVIQGINTDTIVIGNGMGKDFDAKKAMLAIINTARPVVIDADALVPELLKIYDPNKHQWILTPHSSEFARVFGIEATAANISALARKHSLNLCVKGAIDYIIACNDFKIDSLGLLENSQPLNDELALHTNDTGVNQMRVGGTGDALAGIIAAYVAQGFTALQAMRVATRLFGLAGEALARKYSNFSAKSLVKFYSRFIKNEI